MTDKTAKSVKISNIADARAVGSEYGVAFPVRQGRPPLGRLAAALADAGVTVEPTDYFTGEVKAKAVKLKPVKDDTTPAVAKRTDNDVAAVVTLAKVQMVKGEPRKRKGSEEYVYNKTQKVSVTVGEIRGVRGVKKGRPSRSDLITAALAKANVADPSMARVDAVDMVPTPAATDA